VGYVNKDDITAAPRNYNGLGKKSLFFFFQGYPVILLEMMMMKSIRELGEDGRCVVRYFSWHLQDANLSKYE
jgi:hypothetical protein